MCHENLARVARPSLDLLRAGDAMQPVLQKGVVWFTRLGIYEVRQLRTLISLLLVLPGNLLLVFIWWCALNTIKCRPWCYSIVQPARRVTG